MLTTDQLLAIIIKDTIVRTQYAVVRIPASLVSTSRGKAIGQGKCQGVRLYLNSLVLDSTGTDADPPVPQVTNASKNQVYYGDSNGQFHELIAGKESKFIPCRDLQEVWIRGNGTANQVIVSIYLGADDDALTGMLP